jgi:UPF0176 protein
MSSHSSSLTKDLKFKGVNYVFDERIVERISEDVLTKCETCGQPNDSFINCRNFACNVSHILATVEFSKLMILFG